MSEKYDPVIITELLNEHFAEMAKIISDKPKNANTVSLGSVVTIKDLEDNEEATYTIVGTVESDPVNGKISNSCPLGEALVGKTVGDIVEVKAIKNYKVEIVKIEIK